jgi:C-terminal processing protease CtpA/Prc
MIDVRYVENKTIVYKVLDDSLKKDISPGDEIISIGGIPVKKLRDSVAQYIGASNNAALQRNVNDFLMGGKIDTYVKINLLHNGKPKLLGLQRKSNWWATKEQGAVWKKLNDKTGYVDLGRLEVPQVDSMFNDLQSVDAIIIDDRSYPRGTAWALVNYLTDKTVYAAKGTTMIADSPDPLTVTLQDQFWPITVTPSHLQYKGKIIILVNEITQSQAEYTCMVFSGCL